MKPKLDLPQGIHLDCGGCKYLTPGPARDFCGHPKAKISGRGIVRDFMESTLRMRDRGMACGHIGKLWEPKSG